MRKTQILIPLVLVTMLLLFGCGNEGMIMEEGTATPDVTISNQESDLLTESPLYPDSTYSVQDDDTQVISQQDFTDALMDAQEKRINGLLVNMQQYIGRWECEELIQSMAIGQDSTRSQLGIDLLGANIEISEDFTARIDDEVYDIVDIMVTDQQWYSAGLRVVPQHIEGLVIEIYYQHKEKAFSAYFAENGLSFCSYAYGYYSAKRVDDLGGPNEVEPENVLGSQVADMVRTEYLERYGEVNQQLSQMIGTYYGYECVVQENFIAHDGNHSLDIFMEDDKILLFLDKESIMAEQVQVFSSRSRSDIIDSYLQDLEIMVKDNRLMKLYQEHYLLVLGSKVAPTIIIIRKYDQEIYPDPPAIRVYIEGIVYDFYTET